MKLRWSSGQCSSGNINGLDSGIGLPSKRGEARENQSNSDRSSSFLFIIFHFILHELAGSLVVGMEQSLSPEGSTGACLGNRSAHIETVSDL